MKKLLLVATLFSLASAADAASAIAGNWLTEDGKGIVVIGPCGAQVCGKILKITVPHTGTLFDKDNADPKLRGRPLIGLNILSGFKDAGKQWEGQIYSPERGKTYRSVVYRNGNGTLTVKGCVSFLCQTQIWKPAGISG
jgi:uncharacterized protein (DUF2147 family)